MTHRLGIIAGIDLENIVYYRDNTHYFVMTAKKQSLLDKGVVLNVSETHPSHINSFCCALLLLKQKVCLKST